MISGYHKLPMSRAPYRPFAFLLAASLACAAGAAVAAPAPAGAGAHSDTPGIDWFAGDVPAAFAAAQLASKPVFLYWGAKWCPPCQQLKSSVFSRSDFIAKTHQFVAVYLDGDEPGAQKWGETFHVSGYPTVVILRADRREVTRISGGVDLTSYAESLDAALGDVKPLADVLATLLHDPGALQAADCQRLAYYAWEVGYFGDTPTADLATALAHASTSCPGLSASERARLKVVAGALAPTPEIVTAILAIVADHALAVHVADALEGLGEKFYAEVAARGPGVATAFAKDWAEVMETVANDAHVIPADQLYALGTELAVAKKFSDPHAVPPELAATARARLAAVLRQAMSPYARAGVVNAASFIDDELGDTDAEYAMLQGELATAKAPYYYMADLGEIEEHRGHTAAALAWYERAYRESEGIATRFQWGNLYLGALLRLAPQDHARIRRVGLEVIAELDGPDRIQARTRRRLEALDGQLRQWSRKQQSQAVLRVLRARMTTICSKLPSEDGGLEACRRFLAPKV
jgi:thiol-disulfide isomerase/thioredoxin